MLKRLRSLPTPALAISVIALIVAVGGGTFALATNDTQSDKRIAKKVANKQIARHAPQWALVSREGTILAQSGGITINTTNASFGQFFLDFGKSVARRPVSVTLHYGDGGITGESSATPCGGSSVPGGSDCTEINGVNDAKHLFVRTQNSGGTSAPFGFYVSVGG
jgi:hypothetical protein